MNKNELYNTTYGILNDLTPLKHDCGELCDAACCKGDEECGMLLFPGEEELYRGVEWADLKDSDFVLSDGTVIKLLVCNDSCDRDLRPLACRIFPLNCFLDEHDELYLAFDPRALSVCPLKEREYLEILCEEFLEGVQSVFELLKDDSQCYEFIGMLTDELLMLY